MKGWGMFEEDPWYDMRWPEFREPWLQYSTEDASGGRVLYREGAQMWFEIADEDMDSFWEYYTHGNEMWDWDASTAFNE